MAIHELATNAAKYGALSCGEGRVGVSWVRMDEGDGELLIIGWREENGPTVSEPASTGFGSRLVRATIEGSLGGRFESIFEPTGYRCIISLPYGRVTEDEGDSTATLEADYSAVRGG
jgi:two-component system CheB/CheR fusion protein